MVCLLLLSFLFILESVGLLHRDDDDEDHENP